MWHYNKVFIEVFKQRKLTCNMEITFIAKDFADALKNSIRSLTNLKIQDGGQVIWGSRRNWPTHFLKVQTVPFKNKQCRLTNCKVWKKCFWLTFPWNGPEIGWWLHEISWLQPKIRHFLTVIWPLWPWSFTNFSEYQT